MPSSYPTSACRGCGRPIVWARDHVTGKPIPLDPRPPVYVVVRLGDGESLTAERAKDALVSHFVTCPQREQFSRGRKAS